MSGTLGWAALQGLTAPFRSGSPGGPHPFASKWHTAAAASRLLGDLSWPPPYLPHRILMTQVSDKRLVLSRFGVCMTQE